MNSPSSADVAVTRLRGSVMHRNLILRIIAAKLKTSQDNLLLKINKALGKYDDMINLIPDRKKPDAPHGPYIPQLIPNGQNNNHFYTIALQHESHKNQLITYTNGLQEITVDLQKGLMYLPDELIEQYKTELEKSIGNFGDRFRIILNVSCHESGEKVSMLDPRLVSPPKAIRLNDVIDSSPSSSSLSSSSSSLASAKSWKRRRTSSSSSAKKKGGKTRKNKGTPQKKSSAHKTTRKNPKNIRQAKK